MTISIHASAFDVNSWYQKITLTFINESGNPVDMNHAAISFTASGHIDPWGNSGGTLKGNLPLTLNESSYGTLETNNIIINNSDVLLLQPGERGTLSFSLAATQVPVKMSAITLTLASSSSEDAESATPSDQETPAIPAADEQPAEPDVPEKDNDLQEHGLTLNVSELNTASWYQRVTFTLTNLYAQAVDLNQLQLNFTASAHPDPYSPFQGTMLGNQAVTLASDGGWPIEKNTITINHDGALMLAAGDTAELQCYLAATQTPVAISDLNATLAHDPARQGKVCVHFPAMTQTVALKPVIELLFPAGETRRFVGEWGEVLTIGDLSAGTYRLTVPVLANDEMQIAPVESSFTVTLQSGDAAAQVQVSCLPIVRYASARLMIDAPALGNAKLTVEIADTTQADERTITLIANQPQLITRLLAAAIQALPAMAGFIVPSLPTFSDDLYGYIQAVNYLVRQFAPDVAFGWQTNVWATGTADWVLRDTADPVAEGQAIAGFIHELGVYSGEYAPDFIAFDKFERDCFSPDALAHYGWNATCWLNYLAMVKQVTKALLTPAMLWQIPGGHMPTVEEGVSKISAAHFASGGTFFMGDARIGSDPDTLSLQLLNTALNSATYGVPTVGDFLRKDKGYDWGQMQALNLPDFNVFSILWGGGSTISITTIHSNGEDGGWLADKMVEYYAAPRYFR
ncbi:hypothetical protein FHP40_003225 [Salmonella enterica subsp. enterica serovar Hartford]|nr:hypothetical protein [Salmonella enterica]EJV7083296.1 hypothetical protein [Salmonella enterica subsp. enterica serovar Hartford]EJV7084874.1 hypothetical protein [Salmonella enterica subsp. enterica serovar Hartford]EJV7099083.1 hypothetical protein [Salmonella enterica subsp. enterica serovar Hartford]